MKGDSKGKPLTWSFSPARFFTGTLHRSGAAPMKMKKRCFIGVGDDDLRPWLLKGIATLGGE